MNVTKKKLTYEYWTQGITPYTFNKNHLINILVLPYPLLVGLPNGYRVKATEVGNVEPTPKITLYNLLFISSFKYNLISINSLTLHLKCVVSFFYTSCLLQAPSLKRPLEIGKVHDGLYLLCSDCLQTSRHTTSAKNPATCFSHSSNDRMPYPCICHSCLSHQTVINNPFGSKDSVVNADVNIVSSIFPGDTADLLWHYRLVHVPFVKMKGISFISVVFSNKSLFSALFAPWQDKQDYPSSKRPKVALPFLI